MEQFIRTELLLGGNAVKKLKDSRVAVFGKFLMQVVPGGCGVAHQVFRPKKILVAAFVQVL